MGGGGAGGVVGGGGNGGAGGATCTAATEICDGMDNDCDGQVDNVPNLPNGCQCNDGATQECYSGPADTVGVGTCVKGSQTCANGAWGACAGEVVPADETCNLKDDDCDGTVDDMGVTMCGIGGCAAMVDTCVNGVLQQCVPGMPAVEVCDGIDNNCNQIVDETDPALNQVCDSGLLGQCKNGKQTCAMGVLTCAPDKTPVMETCNGIDDDCDGVVDNNIPGTGGGCDTGAQGVCKSGTITCQDVGGGNFTIDCFSDTPASAEICDGLDNDCDGAVDQGDPEGGMACDTGLLGECQPGTLHCVQGGVMCVQNKMSAAETCDGKDNNCDGQADEGNPGGGQACGCSGQGLTVCQNGSVSCQGGPITYFFEDFKDNSKGWTLDTTWQIGPAVLCVGCLTGNPDPAQDHTPTADNGLAGVIIGGPAPTALHDYYWLTSPAINTSGAVGSVYLQFWRFLNSDYASYMTNKVQVSTNNGASWSDLPYGTTGSSPGVRDAAWANHGVGAGSPANPTNQDQYPTQFDLTAYKSATMKVRFGYNIGSAGVYTIGSWSVDDVLVASAICP